jgi:hypothetical protein
LIFEYLTHGKRYLPVGSLMYIFPHVPRNGDPRATQVTETSESRHINYVVTAALSREGRRRSSMIFFAADDEISSIVFQSVLLSVTITSTVLDHDCSPSRRGLTGWRFQRVCTPFC